MGRGVMIILAVSLGLNVLAAGYVAQEVVAEKPRTRDAALSGPGRGGFGAITRHSDVLPEASREEFRAAFRRSLDEMRNDHSALRQMRRELHQLLSAPEWNEDEVAEKLSTYRARRAGQAERFDKAFLEAMGSLPPADRTRLMEEAEKHRATRRDRRRHGYADEGRADEGRG